MAYGVNSRLVRRVGRLCGTQVLSVPAALVAASIASGCGAGGASAPPAMPVVRSGVNHEATAAVDASGFSNKTFGVVRSPRFGVAISLPDRDAWAIVDSANSQGGWIVASHVSTGTILRLRRYDEMSLSGRRECEARARLMGELPSEALAQEKFETLADEPVRRPSGWDGRRWVAFEAARGTKLRGHVYLVSGRRNSCLVVHAIVEVVSDTHVNTLADRLEFLASRVVSSVVIDEASQPKGLSPEFPSVPRPGVP